MDLGKLQVPTGNFTSALLVSGINFVDWINNSGGSSISKRIFGWYVEEYEVLGSSIGPIFRTAAPTTFGSMFVNSKLAPYGNISIDIKTALTPTGVWNSIYSSLPTISAGQFQSSNGILSTPSIASDNYLKMDIIFNSGGSGITAELVSIF